MRRDEGGCADLRRSLTARHKLVRSPTYAPACRPRPRAGLRGARGCARGVFGRGRTGRTPPDRAHRGTRRRERGYRVCHRRAAPPRPGPLRLPAGRSRGPPTLAGTASSARSPPAVITEGRVPANRPRRRTGATRSTARPGPRCREVKSRHCGGDRANRPPLPLDATASPEFPGIRGECERTARGPGNRARRQHSAIGALSYDTYARAAALISRGGDARRGPACTRA